MTSRSAKTLGVRIAVMAGLAAALGGCASVGPDFAVPATPPSPEHFADRHAGSALLAAPADAEGSPLPADPWTAFGDPALLALQARALERNTDLATAALRLAEARVQRSLASAQRGPTAAVSGDVSRQRQSENGAPARFVTALPPESRQPLLDVIGAPFTLYQAGFDVSWEPDFWGRVRRSIEAADADTDAARAALAGVRALVVADVARSYVELRSVRREIALLARQRAVADDVLALVSAQYAAGMIDESATLRAQSVVADLAARLPPLLEREASALRRLELLCDELPGGLDAALAEMQSSAGDAPVAAQKLPDLALGVPSELARRRPDIAAAEARLHAATASIGVAVADLYPRITLGASVGSESVGFSHFTDWNSLQWSIGASLTLPIFDSGRRHSAITLREVQQQEAAIAWQKTVTGAWHEIDAAIAAYMAARRRADPIAARIRTSADALSLARVRFAHGLTDDLPVLDAERTLLEAERDAAENDARVGTALVAVYQALGEDASPGAR